MRKPLQIEMVDAATGEVECTATWQEFQDANFDDTQALDAINEIRNAWLANRDTPRDLMPQFTLGGGAAPAYVLRAAQ